MSVGRGPKARVIRTAAARLKNPWVAWGLFAAAVLLIDREAVAGALLRPLTGATAAMALLALRSLGYEVLQTANIIHQPGGFAYEVYYRCSGALPAACLAFAILRGPGPWKAKLIGIALGLPALALLNLARLVHLFAIGTQRPALFDWIHHGFWNGLTAATVVSVWLIWRKWQRPTERNAVGTDNPGPAADIPWEVRASPERLRRRNQSGDPTV